MKNIIIITLCIFLFILFIPFVVNAENCRTNSIKIKSISMKNKSKNTEELSKVTIENNKINLNLKMYDVGDFIEYKLVLDNITDEVYYFDKDSFNIDSNYFDYEIIYRDDSRRIEPNSKNIVYLRIVYKKEVENPKFLSGIYLDKKNISFNLSNLNPIFVNPLTMNNKLLLFIILFVVFFTVIYLNKNDKLKYNIIMLLIVFLPIQVFAICRTKIEINSNIMIGKVTPNPCTYDGELVQGAEYTNGQYTYRYMQEGSSDEWKDIDNDGWGVVLTNKDSTEDVTTKLCTSINKKAIVSMSSMFYGSKTSKIDLSSFDTSNVVNMSGMFNSCTNINKLNLRNFDTSKVSYMFTMFYSATSLEEVNLDGFDLTSSTSGSNILGGMFSGANNLKRVSMKNWKIPETFTNAIGCRTSSLCSESLEYIDVTDWDLSKTKNLNGLFGNLNAKEIKGLETWDTQNIAHMGNMFGAAKNLKSLNLSSFNTSKVTNMSKMFSDATSLEEVKLDGFDLTSSTSGSNILGGMFSGANNIKRVSMKKWKIPETFFNAIGCRTSSLCSENLEYIDVKDWNLSKTKNLNGLFGNLNAKEIKGLETWDTQNIAHMGNMFGAAKNLKSLNLSSFNTSKVTNMSKMFSDATSLEEVKLDGFDLTSSTSGSSILGDMFFGANNLKRVSMKKWKIPEAFTNAIGCRASSLCSESLEYIDVTDWDLSKTKNLNGLFGNLYAKEIKGLETWDTQNITDMGIMFGTAKNLKSLNLSSFDTSNVTNMSAMFFGAESIKELDLSNFNTKKVTSFGGMFSGCTNLKKLNLSNIDANNASYTSSVFEGVPSLDELDMSNWDFRRHDLKGNGPIINRVLGDGVYNIKKLKVDNSIFGSDMTYAFGGLSNLEDLSLKNVDTTNVTNMYVMFSGLSKIKSLDLSSFDTSNVTNMSSMFSGAKSIKELDLSSFDTSNVTNMSSMFSGAESIKELDLSNFNTKKVTSFGGMFSGCTNLKKLNLSNIDANNASYTSSVFGGVPSLDELDMSNWDFRRYDLKGNGSIVNRVLGDGAYNIKKIKVDNSLFGSDLTYAFGGLSELEDLSLKNVDTTNVTDMSVMFSGLSKIKSLDLSSFDTSNVTDMSSMFSNCSSLKTILVSDKFKVKQVVSSHSMFYNSPLLVGGNGTTYNANHTDKEYARIDTPGALGYFTRK